MTDEARLAKAYLQGLMRTWPSEGGLRRPARNWRAAAVAYAAVSVLGAAACAGEAPSDAADAEVSDTGSSPDADDAGVPVDAHDDQTAIAMYAAPGWGCATSNRKPDGAGLVIGVAAVAWWRRRSRTRTKARS